MAEALQRRPELRPLSREHHHALVLAQQLKHGLHGRSFAGGPTDFAALADLARDAYQRHLVRHFRAEEELLLPFFLRHVPEDHPQVLRLLLDHVGLHRDLRDATSPDRDEAERRRSLETFAHRLEAHARFEERELFELIQATLTSAELEAVGAELARALPEAAEPG